MKNNIKQNCHIKNAILFSSCLLGMLGVGIISHQNTVHADVNNTTTNNNNSNQNSNSSTQSSEASSSEVSQSSSNNNEAQNILSNRISDSASNEPVSSYQSDGVTINIDSDGTSYVAQDPSVIAAISADNQSLNSSDYLPQNGVDSYGTTYESAVNSANASIYAAFDDAAGLNSDGTPKSSTNNSSTNNVENKSANNDSNSNANNSSTNNSSINNSSVDNSSANNSSANNKYASLSPDSLNQLASSVAAQLSSAQIAQNNIKADQGKAQATLDNANSDKNIAESSLTNAINTINNMTSLANGETLDDYKAKLNSAYTAKSAAQDAIDSASNAATLANSNLAQYNNAISAAQININSINADMAGISDQQHINNLTANVQTKSVTIYTGENYNPADSFISATNSDGKTLQLSDFTITSNVNTSKGIQPQDYVVTFTYHSTNATSVVHVINNSSFILRRDNDQHPYTIYYGDSYDPTSLITTLTDDNGNNVDPSLALKDGRLTINQIPGDFSNEGKNVSGYFLSYNYYPDGQQYAPVFNGQVKVYTLNNSNLITQPANLTVDNSFDQKSVITGLINAHGETDNYDNAIRDGQLTFTNINSINSSKPGTYPIIATYYGKQYQINVNVLDKTSLGLANNAVIKAGTTFDPQSGVSTATDVKGNVTTYNNIEQNGSLTISGLDKLNTNVPGDYTIDYNYGGKTYPYKITVLSQKDIEYTRNPTAFYAGSNITPDELFKSITNDIGKTVSYEDAIKDGLQFDLSNVDANKVGTYLTKAIYGGIVYPLEIQIQQAPTGYNNSNNNSAQPNPSSSANASFNNSSSSNNVPAANSNNDNNSSNNNYSVNNDGGITFYTNGTTAGSSAATNSAATNSSASSTNSSAASSSAAKSSAAISFTKVGKAATIYVNNTTPTYRFSTTTKENHGVYAIDKNGYTKVKAQLVKTESGVYYKLADGRYIDADTKGLKNIVKTGKHQVQLTSDSAKVYRHLFKKSKSVKTLNKGTVLHVDKVVSHKNKLYYKLFDSGKNYFVEANPNNFTSTVGLVNGMELYIHGNANIYKDAKLKHVKSNVAKGKSLTVILKNTNKDGVWKTNKGYVDGKKLLKSAQIYNNIFGN